MTDGSVFNSGRVSVVDTTTYLKIAGIPVGVGPHRLAVSPDGKYVYVANFSSKDVSVIATSSNKVIATISLNGTPWAMDLLGDGTRLYIPVYNGQIAIVDTTTNIVLDKIAVGSQPTAVAIFHR